MKRFIIFLVLGLLSIGVSGCESAAPVQSTFKANFSLNAIVEANREFLLEEARISSGAETGLREPFVQSHEEMTVQIDPADTSQFFQAIRLNVADELANNNADVLGHGLNGSEDIGVFSYSYQENGLFGTITVWGIQGEGTNYYLIAIITES